MAAISPERLLQAQAPVAAHDRRANDPQTPDQPHRCGRGRGHRSDGRIEHRSPTLALGCAARYELSASAGRPYAASIARRASSVMRSMEPSDSSRLFRPWYWRIPAICLADAHATNARASHVHVRVRLALPAVGRSPGGGPRGGDTFPLRYALLWSSPQMSVVPAGWVGVAFLFYKNGRACEAARKGSLIANTGVRRGGSGRDKLFNGPSESEHKEETQ
jgi:hypothetical protein